MSEQRVTDFYLVVLFSGSDDIEDSKAHKRERELASWNAELRPDAYFIHAADSAAILRWAKETWDRLPDYYVAIVEHHPFDSRGEGFSNELYLSPHLIGRIDTPYASVKIAERVKYYRSLVDRLMHEDEWQAMLAERKKRRDESPEA